MDNNHFEQLCSICLDKLSYQDGNVCMVNCPSGHLYHKKCINQWASPVRVECPICRQNINEYVFGGAILKIGSQIKEMNLCFHCQKICDQSLRCCVCCKNRCHKKCVQDAEENRDYSNYWKQNKNKIQAYKQLFVLQKREFNAFRICNFCIKIFHLVKNHLDDKLRRLKRQAKQSQHRQLQIEEKIKKLSASLNEQHQKMKENQQKQLAFSKLVSTMR